MSNLQWVDVNNEDSQDVKEKQSKNKSHFGPAAFLPFYMYIYLRHLLVSPVPSRREQTRNPDKSGSFPLPSHHPSLRM
jgi:hypothetical protein